MKVAVCLFLVAGLLGCQSSLPAVPPAGQETQAPAGQNEDPKQKDEKKKTSVKLKGRIVDRDAKAVANAEVIFDGPKHANVVTDATGSFTFEGPPGAYTIKVRSGGKEQTFAREIASDKLELIVE